ncbi:arrestin domain-containing protein 3-like isoform X2 [Haliotis rubra]|uniref:arrestin domain-containing protein 3-like isoform X2 n=1 Tax=Haliotis rubra TaxID=36100 RepID=UPI001EE5C10E|nr:arrestin domain-containing protein 3-like isoform X2 [Haliotis rubra]
MSTFQTCAVLLDGGKEVYRPGEPVTGELVLDVTENVTVKGVRVYLYGQTLVKWDEYSSSTVGGTKDYVAREKYFGRVFTVFGKGQNVSGPNHTLTTGQHNYRYKFTLPKEGLPSSFEGEFGATRYWVKVEVERPFPNFDKCWYTGITVLDDINVNDYKATIGRAVVKQVSKALGFGNAGSLSLNVEIDRGAYCAGEKVALKVVVKNESTKDLGKLKAQLEQKIVFTAHNETKNIHNIIRILESFPIKKGEERVWNNQLLDVDSIPASTKMRSCHVIEVRYFIRVLVEVPFGLNLETTMPVTIGTIPYGHTPASGLQLAVPLRLLLPRLYATPNATAESTFLKNQMGILSAFSTHQCVPLSSITPSHLLDRPQLRLHNHALLLIPPQRHRQRLQLRPHSILLLL